MKNEWKLGHLSCLDIPPCLVICSYKKFLKKRLHFPVLRIISAYWFESVLQKNTLCSSSPVVTPWGLHLPRGDTKLHVKWVVISFWWARRTREEFSLRKIGREKKLALTEHLLCAQTLEHMIWINHFMSFKQISTSWYLQMNILRIRARKTTKVMTLGSKAHHCTTTSWYFLLCHQNILTSVTPSLVLPGAREREREQHRHNCYPMMWTEECDWGRTQFSSQYIPKVHSNTRTLQIFFLSYTWKLGSWASSQNCF